MNIDRYVRIDNIEKWNDEYGESISNRNNRMTASAYWLVCDGSPDETLSNVFGVFFTQDEAMKYIKENEYNLTAPRLLCKSGKGRMYMDLCRIFGKH